MKDKILTLIHTDARFVKGCTSSNMQRCFAIKPGINELLDVARQIYCELISDMKSKYIKSKYAVTIYSRYIRYNIAD
jgi:DNA mismatch repair protein MSH4